MIQLKRSGMCGVLLLALMAGGCANIHPTQSGYLSAYPPAPAKRSFVKALLDNKEFGVQPAGGVDLSGVDSFYIEEIVWRAEIAKRENAEPSRREPLIAGLRAALAKQLGSVRPIVDQPGPKTAKVRAAITEVVDANLLYNVVMTIVAVPLSNGGAAVEAEVMSPEGKQLAAVDYAEVGAWYDIFGYFLPQAHAQGAMKGAAKELKMVLVGKPVKKSGD